MITSPPSAAPGRRPWVAGLVLGGCLLAVAVVGLLRFRHQESTSAEDLVAEGRVALARHEASTAARCAEEAVRHAPDLASGWKLLADASAQCGDIDRTLSALTSWGRIDPDAMTRFAVTLGSKLMKDYHVAQAKTVLQCAVDTTTQAPEPYRLLAQIAGVTGRPRELQAALLELVRRRSFTRQDLLTLGALNPYVSDPERVQQILKVNPNDPSPLLASALDALNANQVPAAVELLTEVIRANGRDREAQGILGNLYADVSPDEFPAWHAALPGDVEDDARVWLARGKWLRQQGELRSAARCFREAVVREPELQAATIGLGQALVSLGQEHPGDVWIARATSLQRISDLLTRMREPHAAEWMGPLIDELESAGRIWEAWGWSVVQTQSPGGVPSDKARRDRLSSLLSFDLPRTVPGALPDDELDAERFPLPAASLFRAAPSSGEASLAESAAVLRFEDRAPSVGLDVRFVNSYVPETGRRVYETMGAGVGVLDYDQDGWPDLYFPQGKRLPLESRDGPSDALYRNLSGERYVPTTVDAGIDETTYSQGVAVGDFDNDGFPDVYVANLGRNRLFRNNGDGTLSDATDQAGLTQTLWTVSCAMADLSGDGLPDLFDVNYVQGEDFLFRTCLDERQRPVVCRPTVFEAAPDTAAVNLGDGRFEEEQAQAGLDLPQGMGLGIEVADFNEDGRLDVFVANDQTANHLLINDSADPTQPLRFREEAAVRGVAFDLNGTAQACMGVACADVNRDGLPDLHVTNFAKEANTLYLSQPGGYFEDTTQRAGLRDPSFAPLGFGTQFLDADCDGWFDLIVGNGHIDELADEPYRMKTQLFRGLPDSRFTEVTSPEAGELFAELRLARGVAILDWNRDGLSDFVTTDLERPVLLAVNRTETSNHSLRLKLIGITSSRDAIGANVRVQFAPGDQRSYQLTAGDGYESSNERMIAIAAGPHERLSRIEITWPSGQVSQFEDVVCVGEWLAVEGCSRLIPRAQP